jgi:hypothetical protein
MTKIISKRARVLIALAKGEKLTAKQITSRFKVANPSATISDLRRRDSQNVVVTRTTAKNGVTTSKYMLLTVTTNKAKSLSKAV